MKLDLEPAFNYPLRMQVTLEIPDDMAGKLAPQGQDPARAALEAVAIEGYRSGALSAYQTRRLLRFETRYELDGFLKAHNVWEHAYGLEDLEQDRQTLRQLASEGRLTR
jgi:predicted HTH domain antitoxin